MGQPAACGKRFIECLLFNVPRSLVHIAGLGKKESAIQQCFKSKYCLLVCMHVFLLVQYLYLSILSQSIFPNPVILVWPLFPCRLHRAWLSPLDNTVVAIQPRKVQYTSHYGFLARYGSSWRVKNGLIHNLLSDGVLVAQRLQLQKFIQWHYVTYI